MSFCYVSLSCEKIVCYVLENAFFVEHEHFQFVSHALSLFFPVYVLRKTNSLVFIFVAETKLICPKFPFILVQIICAFYFSTPGVVHICLFPRFCSH